MSTIDKKELCTAASALPRRHSLVARLEAIAKGQYTRLSVDGPWWKSPTAILLSPRQVGDQVTVLGRNWSRPFNGRIGLPRPRGCTECCRDRCAEVLDGSKTASTPGRRADAAPGRRRGGVDNNLIERQIKQVAAMFPAAVS